MGTEQSVFDLWDAFHADRCATHRNALVLHYAGLAKQVAAKRAATTPGVDPEDVYQDAVEGLIAAIDKFTPPPGADAAGTQQAFFAYAQQRIRGRVVDCIRDLDTLSRRTRAQIAAVDEEQPAAATLLRHQLAHTVPVATVDPDDVRLATAALGGDGPDMLGFAVAALPAKQRAALTLLYVHNVSVMQVAAVLRTTDRSIRNWHQQALRDLRAAVAA